MYDSEFVDQSADPREETMIAARDARRMNTRNGRHEKNMTLTVRAKGDCLSTASARSAPAPPDPLVLDCTRWYQLLYEHTDV
jgi:hypothetical protein